MAVASCCRPCDGIPAKWETLRPANPERRGGDRAGQSGRDEGFVYFLAVRHIYPIFNIEQVENTQSGGEDLWSSSANLNV